VSGQEKQTSDMSYFQSGCSEYFGDNAKGEKWTDNDHKMRLMVYNLMIDVVLMV